MAEEACADNPFDGVDIGQLIATGDLTLDQILELSQHIDEGNIDATPEQMGELVDALKDKADSCYYYWEDLEAQRARLKIRSEVISKEDSKLANKQRYLLNLIMKSMKNRGFERVPGNEWAAKIKRGRGKLIDLESPEPVDLIKHKGMVDTKYSWKKTEVKKFLAKKSAEYSNRKDLDEEDESYKEFVKFSKRFRIHIDEDVTFEPVTEKKK